MGNQFNQIIIIMKKFLFILAFAVVSVAAFAQTPYKTYCEIVGTGNILGTKIKSVEVDMGQEMNYKMWGLSNSRVLADENGEKVEFNSMMDAVNFFGRLGWRLHSTYAITESSMGGKVNVYHYIFEKEVTDDKQAMEGIYFKK